LNINKAQTANFSYSSSAAAVVFGVYVSAWAVFRLEPLFAARQETKIGVS